LAPTARGRYREIGRGKLQVAAKGKRGSEEKVEEDLNLL